MNQIALTILIFISIIIANYFVFTWLSLKTARISLLSPAIASEESEIWASDESRHSIDRAGEGSAPLPQLVLEQMIIC